jgi:hypothetical protein
MEASLTPVRREPPLYPSQFAADADNTVPQPRQKFENARLRVLQRPQRFTYPPQRQRLAAAGTSDAQFGSE